jgi:hypothetical protein
MATQTQSQMSIETVMLAICEQMIPMITPDYTLTAKQCSEAIFDALAEANITIEMPHVPRVSTETQTKARKNASNWHAVKAIPEELAYWFAITRMVPNKPNSYRVLSTWNVFSMFGGDKSRVPTPINGVIARPNKK